MVKETRNTATPLAPSLPFSMRMESKSIGFNTLSTSAPLMPFCASCFFTMAE